MSAKTIMIIRHAERPMRGVGGVDLKGSPDDHSLVTRGWQRAGALAMLFNDPPKPLTRPDHIFAASESRSSESKRPLQTVTPLAQKLGLNVDSSFAKGDEAKMVVAVKSLHGAVLVAWQHEAIPTIARLISDGVPYPHWSPSCYDEIWLFIRHHRNYRFLIVPQRALDGDSHVSPHA